MSITGYIQLIVSGIALGAIYAMIAIGFNIIYNSTGIINFAQGEFAMLGGMTIAYLTAKGWPVAPALAVTVLGVGLIGVLFERLAIRPVRDARVLVLVLITLGGSFVIRGLARMVFGLWRMVDEFNEGFFTLVGVTIKYQELWVWFFLALLVVGLTLFFRKTLTGRAMQACAANRRAASLVGISPSRMVMFAFGLSAAIGALGGAVVAPISQVNFDHGAKWGLMGFCAAVLGGLGNMIGAVVAGLLLGILESLAKGRHLSEYSHTIALAILILMLFVRPSGIFGRADVSALKEF